MDKTVSIIVAVYKVERYIRSCVDSILCQSYKNIEVILVDDGSPDECGRICDEYERADSRVRVIHQKNAGLSAARNAGMAEARGEYIYFVDGDDCIDSRLCEKCIECLESTGADAVVFGYDHIDEDGHETGICFGYEPKVLCREGALCELMSGTIRDYAWNKLYRRELYDGIEWPIAVTWEDIATTYKLLMRVGSMAVMEGAYYHYRQRKNSITANISTKGLEDIFRARSDRYTAVSAVYEQAAELGFSDLATSALRLYDRSVWSDTDRVLLGRACEFLSENKEKIMHSTVKGAAEYYSCPRLYRAKITLRHLAGNALRWVRGVLGLGKQHR